MNDAEAIQRARDLDAKATKGPWITGSIPWKVWANGGSNTVCDVGACGDAIPVPGMPEISTSESMAANRDYIAQSRTLLPDLANRLGAALARVEWRPVSSLDKSKMQFLLTHRDGAQRTLLWNPRGFWEHPLPIGCVVAPHDEPTEFMELPENPPALAQLTETK